MNRLAAFVFLLFVGLSSATNTSVCDGVSQCSTMGAIILDNVTIHYDGDASPDHSFVVALCDVSHVVPTDKSRAIIAGGSPGACASGYVTQFGSRRSWVNCEIAFDTVVHACAWVVSNTSGNLPAIHCTYGSSTQDQSMLVLHLLCPSSGVVVPPVVEVDASGDIMTLVAYEAFVCGCGVLTSTRSTSTVLADALIGSVIALLVVGLSYNVGHNYLVKGLRGWDLVPWAARFSRRSAGGFDPVATEDLDETDH